MAGLFTDGTCQTAFGPGTGTTVTLLAVQPGFRTFLTAGYGAGDPGYYTLMDATKQEWGLGTINTTAGTITRDTVIGNTSGNTSRLNFAGSCFIFSGLPADKAVCLDQNGTLVVPANIALKNNQTFLVKDSGGTNRSALFMSAADDLTVLVAGGSGKKFRVLTQNASTELLSVTNAGVVTMTCGSNVAQVTGIGFRGGLGYETKDATAGTYTSHVFNIDWTGSAANLYIDGTSVGAISLTSDSRIKQNIRPVSGALSRIRALLPKVYNYADVGIFRDDGRDHVGFLADDVRDVIPSAVQGEPGAVTPDGDVIPMSLVPMPLVAELVAALKELADQFDEYVETHP